MIGQVTVSTNHRTHLGTRRAVGFRHPTHRHIPGSVLRGAFAAAWIARHGGTVSETDRPRFLELFEGGVTFGPLTAGTVPPPASLQLHKYQGAECAKATWDAALEETPARCPECGSPLEGARADDQWNPQIPLGPRTVSRSHVSIGADDVAVDGNLFAIEQLRSSDDVPFAGRITFNDDHLVDELSGIDKLRIGGRRSVSGVARVAIHESSTVIPHITSDGLVVLSLISPAVLVDERGLPSAVPSQDDLERVLGCGGEVIRSWRRWTEVGGWHMASGLPKHVETAVDAGGTYLIKPHERVRAEDVALHLGLGLRRHEGFGALASADEVGRTAE